MKHVIIGAGIAGVTAAQTIKELDSDAEVVVLGNERIFPYRRYLLTEFLCGSADREELNYTSVDSIKEMGIKLRKGQHVKFIDVKAKSIKLFHNEIVHYDKLLIATGGRPGLGPVLRSYKQYIQRYYTMKDILLLKKQLPNINECVVYGDGLSSLDLLCGLYNLGKKITYIVKGSRADFSLTETDFYAEVHDFLEKKGINIISDDRIISIEPTNGNYCVKTLKQVELTADVIFAWDYYKPNLTCIKGTSIEKKLGILVNENLKTSEDDIYAAGDCTEIYHPGIKDYWINFGWPNATQQGKVAAMNMVGKPEAYRIRETLTVKLMGKSLEARWWK
jgi:3-phenylpropionate/trans-cinnamate dioxygenase ferredoxin reductase component